MKILHVNAFDAGGAARAALRLHEALRQVGVDSRFVTIKPSPGQDGVSSPLGNWQIATAYAKRHAATKLARLQKTPGNEIIHSLGQFPSGLGKWIESSDADIVNLHWVCAEALSVGEIARITKPTVWTMHDMWPFMGAEHYDDLGQPGRWKTAYTAANRPPSYSGPDIDRCVWRRKAKLWSGKKFHLVAPSHWLARCARESALMGAQACEVIHNPLDTQAFSPVDKREARSMLGLPAGRKLILFGALASTSDPRKGYDLLLTALRHLEQDHGADQDTDVIVFGGGKSGDIPGGRMKTHFLGAFHDDLSLRVVYSAADVFVAPSRQDNLPNTIIEAGACGLPTAAFAVGGIPDIVKEDETGKLAAPFDAKALAGCIHSLLVSPISHETVRSATEAKFSVAATIPAYLSLYRKVLCL